VNAMLGDPGDLRRQMETAVKHVYDPSKQHWSKEIVRCEIAPSAFQRGTLRLVHRAVEIDSAGESRECVAKFFDPEKFATLNLGAITRAPYYGDVVVQSTAAALGAEYNSRKPPKNVHFVDCWLLELVSRPGSPLCFVEPQLNGTYEKHNDNWGGVFSTRQTPQAYSHFSWEASKHTMLVVDIQGVGDLWTDPRIHSNVGKKFGIGDKGIDGISRFVQSHKCNSVCIKMGLPGMSLGPPRDLLDPVHLLLSTAASDKKLDFMERQRTDSASAGTLSPRETVKSISPIIRDLPSAPPARARAQSEQTKMTQAPVVIESRGHADSTDARIRRSAVEALSSAVDDFEEALASARDHARTERVSLLSSVRAALDGDDSVRLSTHKPDNPPTSVNLSC